MTRWPVALSAVAIAGTLMVLVASILIPYGRFILHALYGILANLALRPFGLALPAVVTFLVVNVALLATSLAAGRRIGAFITHYAVDRQLGSHAVTRAIPWIAGLAGASAFAATVPWATSSDATAALPLQLTYAAFGYILYLAVLLLGPPWGAGRYLRINPYCPQCWVWMQRETGGGSFLPEDRPTILAALTAGRFAGLRDLPSAAAGTRATFYFLHWWQCPSCHDEGVVACAVGDADGPPASSQRIDARGLAELRDLITHRRALA